MQPLQAVVTVAFLAATNKFIVDYFVTKPLEQKDPNGNHWWILYFALATGFALAWFAQVNLFTGIVADPLVGRIVTGILVGGGSSLIHDVVTAYTEEPKVVQAVVVERE